MPDRPWRPTDAWRCLHSWWKQERCALPPLSGQRRLVGLALALVTLLSGLELQRRWAAEQHQRDQRLMLAQELLDLGLHQLRQPEAAMPLTAVVNPHGQALRVLGPHGRSPSQLRPLLRCGRDQLISNANNNSTNRASRMALCADASDRWWITSIQASDDPLAPAAVIRAAPLQNPRFGSGLQALVADLEAQIQLQPVSGPAPSRALRTPWAEPLRGAGGRLAFLQPRPLAPQLLLALLADLPWLALTLVVLLALRIRLQLEQRRCQLRKAQRERGLRRRLRQVQRQLDHRCSGLSADTAEASRDWLDALTRRLEQVERRNAQCTLRDAASGWPTRLALLDQLLFLERQGESLNVWLLHWPAAKELAAADLQLALASCSAALPITLYGARISAERFAWAGPAGSGASPLAEAARHLTGPWLLVASERPPSSQDLELWLQTQERQLLHRFIGGERGLQQHLQAADRASTAASQLRGEWAIALQLDQLALTAQRICDPQQQVLGLALTPSWPSGPIPQPDPERLQRWAAEQGLAAELLMQLLHLGLLAWRSLSPRRRQRLELHLWLDPQALQEATLPQRIQAALQDSGFPPQLLTLSCRQADLHTCLRNDRRLLEAWQSLQQQGVALQRTDCGEAPSQFIGLDQRIPVDRLLCPAALTTSIASEPAAAALVQEWIRLADRCGLTVTAEAVHTIGQQQRLLALGVTRFQESKAIPVDDTMIQALEQS